MDSKEEVKKNYEAFEQMLPDLLANQKGKFALMHDGEVIEFFDTVRDAFITGQKLYSDNLFSVQEVVETPVDLGYFSHAIA